MFTIKSRTWNLIVIIGSIAIILVGWGGLFGLQGARSGATATNLFVIGLGILTFLFFAGPGIAFVLRKRIPFLKKHLPGGSLTWVRAHLYLPILALVAAYIHATSAPFRGTLSSGKVLLGIGIVVSICGVARHHLIGVSKAAVNADAQISRIASQHSRPFRQLVIDYKQLRRPLGDIQADAQQLPPDEQAAWAQVLETQAKIDHDFPRGGGQSRNVRAYKLLRAIHAPLTVVLFIALSFHVVDVLGVTDTVTASDKERIASVSDCNGCHSEIVEDWKQSAMAHAQTGTIMEAQLPVTLAKNEELAKQLGAEQQDLYDNSAQVCINCHAPVAAVFIDDPNAVLPVNETTDQSDTAAVPGGGEAINQDGVGCLVCHTQSAPLGELAGAGKINIASGTRDDYGTVYGPLFDDPNPLPVRVHDIAETDKDGFWNDPIATSIACGACHNVKLDIDGDGTSPFSDDDNGDDDGDHVLNGNEPDKGDDDQLDDLVLQTTFDEWQDYVAAFDDTIAQRDSDFGVNDRPLGCIDCHMPSNTDNKDEPVVDAAPGVLPTPDRPHRSHTFIGVDYDLDIDAYTDLGLSKDTINKVIAERAALLGSAVTMQVDDATDNGDGTQTANVVVTNNLLGHSFPTGFAFARQFWLEVSATDSEGNEVCLVNPFAGTADAPCASGVVADRDALVPQCDPQSVADTFGIPIGQIPDGNIKFAEPLPVGECDPWLANFQKILTDGDPTGSGTFSEVPYQSFLPDIVKTRHRMFDNLTMAPLQSVELNDNGEPQDSLAIPYTFDTSQLAAGDAIDVKATLHFRHLPPEFVRSLAAAQQGLTNITPSARIDDPDALTKNLVITDVVSAQTGDGPQLACKGPQNEEGATIVDCVGDVSGIGAVELNGGASGPGGSGGKFVDPWLAAGVVGAFTVAGALFAGRDWPTRRRRRRRPATV